MSRFGPLSPPGLNEQLTFTFTLSVVDVRHVA